MKIQFATRVKDRFGNDIQEPDMQKPTEIGQPPSMKSITLGDICCSVLDAVFQDEANEGLKPKLRRAELIAKITASEKSISPMEILDADREMIKERIGKRNYSVTMTASAVRLLDEAVEEDK